jgi:hypothetical protein
MVHMIETHPTVAIEVDRNLMVAFRAEAAKRDMPVASLIRDLLDVIVTDKLTGAILDDERPPRKTPRRVSV